MASANAGGNGPIYGQQYDLTSGKNSSYTTLFSYNNNSLVTGDSGTFITHSEKDSEFWLGTTIESTKIDTYAKGSIEYSPMTWRFGVNQTYKVDWDQVGEYATYAAYGAGFTIAAALAIYNPQILKAYQQLWGYGY